MRVCVRMLARLNNNWLESFKVFLRPSLMLFEQRNTFLPRDFSPLSTSFVDRINMRENFSKSLVKYMKRIYLCENRLLKSKLNETIAVFKLGSSEMHDLEIAAESTAEMISK